MRLFLLSLVLIIFLIGNQPAESWKLNANFKVKCKVQKRLFWFLNLSNISISTHFTFKRLEYDIKLSGSYTTIDQVRSQVDCSIRCILSPPPYHVIQYMFLKSVTRTDLGPPPNVKNVTLFFLKASLRHAKLSKLSTN